MSSDTLADAWLRLWSPTINMPGSGSIGGFNYHPYTTWQAPFSGNQTVELGVYNEVASPGKQLGKLTDAVLELATILEHVDPKIKGATRLSELRELDNRIKSVKERIEKSAEKQAEKMLDELRTNDPETLKRLLAKYSTQ
ncbi:MAG TPA: hypothetical protein VFM32_05035 [Spongiibacteraceae bacterium]|nr:hypothetical protein [Spongiibacteraceae bacterium]